MKHIKAYEELKIDDIKKYIVWIGKNIEILKLDYINDTLSNNNFYIKAFDYLLYKNGEFKPNSSENSTWIGENEIKIMSDDLEKCKEYIELYIAQDKYNL